MALNVPKEALRALLASLSGLPSSRVVWTGEKEGPVGPIGGKAGKLTLNVIARETNGDLEPRRDFDAASNSLSEEWGAHRGLTVSVRADEFLGRGEAFDTLEAVRFGLALESSRAALHAADLAFLDAPSVVQLEYRVDNRAVSSATLDLRFAHVVSKVTADPAAGTGAPYIEKVTSKPGPFTPEEITALPVADTSFTKSG